MSGFSGRPPLTKHQQGVASRTRCLRPVEDVSLSTQDVLSGLLAALSPAALASVNLLHGQRKGVIRLTCKTPEAADELAGKVAARRVQVNGVRLAPVGDSGHFIHVSLYDVPQQLSGADVERHLKNYGNVVHTRREYIDYHGYRIENETRHVLFSEIHREIPPKITMDGQDVYVQYRSPGGARGGAEADPIISQSGNLPKHVMTSIAATTSDNFRRAGGGRSGSPSGSGPETGSAVAPAGAPSGSPDRMSSGSEKGGATLTYDPRARGRGAVDQATTRRSVSANPSPNLPRRMLRDDSRGSDLGQGTGSRDRDARRGPRDRDNEDEGTSRDRGSRHPSGSEQRDHTTAPDEAPLRRSDRLTAYTPVTLFSTEVGTTSRRAERRGSFDHGHAEEYENKGKLFRSKTPDIHF